MKRVVGMLLVLLPLMAEASADLDTLNQKLKKIDVLLDQWQFVEAKKLSESLLKTYPDLPAVQFSTAWVKFHLGEHRSAYNLATRAAAAFKDKLASDPRLAFIQNMERITRPFTSFTSADGKIEIWYEPPVDKVLIPDLVQTISKTLQVVGKDLDHVPKHKIVIQVLPNAEALAAATGLTGDEIDTSGTIAVCKFGRLMIISPRNTLKGYSYLDTASHELVHLIISQKTFNRTPIWLHEALAKYEDSRWRSQEPLYRKGLSPQRQSNLAEAIRNNSLITFEQMHPSMALLPSQQAAELAFSEVYTVTEYLLSMKGYPGIQKVLTLIAQGEKDLVAIEKVYGLNRQRFASSWIQWLRARRFRTLEGEAQLEKKQERSSTQAERTLSRNRRTDLRDHFHLGQLLRARNRLNAAAWEFEQARKKTPNNHAALWIIADKLGQVLLALGRNKEAVQAFQTSLDINPGGLESQLHLGQALANDDPFQAFLHLREASRRNPLDPRVHRALYVVCKRLAEKNDQRYNFEALAQHHRAAYHIVQLVKPNSTTGTTDSSSRKKTASSGTLRILTEPWARIFLDFVDTGLTTPVYQLDVEAGSHSVGLICDCLEQPEVVWVQVKPGSVTVIDQELCKPKAQRKPEQKETG